MQKWYTLAKGDPSIMSTSIFQCTATHVAIAYQDPLVASLKSLQVLEIKKEKVNSREEQILSIVMKRCSCVKVVVPVKSYIPWVSAFEKKQGKHRVNLHLCRAQKSTNFSNDNDTDKEDELLLCNNLDDSSTNDLLILSKRALDLDM
ncbi:unnamed protein product [Mucor circinelloides]